MIKDASAFVRKCSPCQKHANHLHNPATFMKIMESPCPFDMWGMDIVGKLPHATGQREYLIVAVDYFTKWFEVEPLAKISEKEVIKFIWQNLICRFGIPRALVTDNGTQFQGGKLKSWLEELKIKQLFTSVNNPEASGQAEVTNMIILQQLRTRLGENKESWVDELSGVLWAYCTTPRESTQEMPFSLVYGTEAVIPSEIGKETWRIKSYDNSGNSKSRRIDLDLLDEKREVAERRIHVYKNKMARAYDDKVRPQKFK
ncbi:UNVERIFIED_CONTAM: hypothetical protein Slati_1784600 [Sesamum latifolium]|uniref:Integrase catalytic domain-containing protein n=1 Tax=Sesamum latifolium TaxID=2727402 RepID=A0AAW2X1Q4_9LAMI